MKLRHVLPFALLFAWQVAPQRPDTTAQRTRVSFSLGYGLATLEDYIPAEVNCYGNQLAPEQSRAVDVQSRGARLDIVHGQFHATGFAGRVTSGGPDMASSFSGFQLAFEGERAGFGAGLTFGTPIVLSSTSPEPNFYVRIGDRRTHLRADYMPPSETFGIEGFWRVGVGFDQSQTRGISGFVGAGQAPYGSLVGLVDLAIPMLGGLDLLLRGLAGPGHQHSPWGLALGARFTFQR